MTPFYTSRRTDRIIEFFEADRGFLVNIDGKGITAMRAYEFGSIVSERIAEDMRDHGVPESTIYEFLLLDAGELR